MTWLLIGYMWLFIHRPFEIWPVFATFHIERVYMIFTIMYWLTSNPKLPSGNRLHWYQIGFVLVILTSWLLSPYNAAGYYPVRNYLQYTVFCILLVTSVRDIPDIKKILAGHVCIMALFMLHALREFFNGSAWYAGILRLRAPGSTFSDYNDFAGLVVCGLPIAWVFWYEWTSRWKRTALAAYFGTSGYCIMLTASRMGACGFVLAAALASLASPHRWRLLVMTPILFVAVWVVLPEKHRERYYSLVDPSTGDAGARSSAGHLRYSGFERGLVLFEQRPLFGFGPGATGQATGTGMMFHNMYGQLLGELGLAGALTFGFMAFAVGLNVLEARRISHGRSDPDILFLWRAILATSVSYLLLLFMGWGFNFLLWHVWLWFGGFQLVAMECLKSRVVDEMPDEIEDEMFDETMLDESDQVHALAK